MNSKVHNDKYSPHKRKILVFVYVVCDFIVISSQRERRDGNLKMACLPVNGVVYILCLIKNWTVVS